MLGGMAPAISTASKRSGVIFTVHVHSSILMASRWNTRWQIFQGNVHPPSPVFVIVSISVGYVVAWSLIWISVQCIHGSRRHSKSFRCHPSLWSRIVSCTVVTVICVCEAWVKSLSQLEKAT